MVEKTGESWKAGRKRIYQMWSYLVASKAAPVQIWALRLMIYKDKHIFILVNLNNAKP